MTVISYTISKDDNVISYFCIEGHSGYLYKGKDIVCSALSSIVNGSINFLSSRFKKYLNFTISPYKGPNPKIEIYIFEKIENKKVISDIQICLEMLIFQLENIKKKYNSYIKIKEKHE